MPTLEYFYAAHSAFAYLGSRRLQEIASNANCVVVHKPFDLGRTMQAIGALTFRERTPAHRAYFFGREIERWSDYRAAPVMGRRPTHHDNDVGLANRVIIAAVNQALAVDELSHALLQAHWRDDADLADDTTLTELIQSVGLDADVLLTAARSAAVEKIYLGFTTEAIERSVFGSPTYFLDGDMYYGQDRLELIEHALSC